MEASRNAKREGCNTIIIVLSSKDTKQAERAINWSKIVYVLLWWCVY